MNILIDADGCPVVDLTLQIAKRFGVPVIILCDTAHQIEREGAQTLVFDKGADSVDFALVNRVKPGDIVVTQDYGLASMCLAKRARVLNQNGLEYTADNMFLIYFIIGASCGYVQLRNTETSRFVQNENNLLRQRLQFTQELYEDTLEDKQLFRHQILGRRDSFGKIYTVTQQLNTLQPQEIYRKTIQVMEDILENHSLTIYHLEKGYAFARLTAASSGLQPAPARSLAVDKYIDVFRAIEQDGVWVNRTFAPDLPMYAAGVRQNGSIVVLISLRTAGENQMTLYYQNLFRILCGLVETALIRAFEYESAIQETWYLPGTCLMRPVPFAEQLANACTLQEDKMAQHLLLRVSGKFATSEEFYAQLERSIRSSDIAGLGTDENVYLLLNQATEENLPLLTQRMAEKGFQVTSVSLDGQHRLIAAAKKDPVNEC